MQIKRGQKVWAWICHCGIVETTVKSIGRKYIRVHYDERIKYDVNSLREIDGAGYGSYIILDLEKYNRKEHYRTLAKKLRSFNWNELEHDKLDKISEVLNL